MEHALPPENGDFLVELELLFILFRFGPPRSKDNLSQRNVPRGLKREETAVLAGYSGTCVIYIPNQEPTTVHFATLFKTRLALFYDPDSFRFALSTEGVTDVGNFLNYMEHLLIVYIFHVKSNIQY